MKFSLVTARIRSLSLGLTNFIFLHAASQYSIPWVPSCAACVSLYHSQPRSDARILAWVFTDFFTSASRVGLETAPNSLLEHSPRKTEVQNLSHCLTVSLVATREFLLVLHAASQYSIPWVPPCALWSLMCSKKLSYCFYFQLQHLFQLRVVQY